MVCVRGRAARGLKVMLDGQGADEQLAGYHGCFSYYFAGLIRQRQFATLLHAMLQRRAWHGVSFADQVRTFLLPLAAGEAGPLAASRAAGWWRNIIGSTARHCARISAAARSRLRARASGGRRSPIIGDLCVVLTQSSNLAMLLHWEDRNSMAHGIEARVPFLDHRLVEFSIALGDRHKIVGGDTKRVLRRAMDGILPDTGA